MKKGILISCFLLFSLLSIAQSFSNIRSKRVQITDTVFLDTLSLVPNSVSVFVNSQQLDSTSYYVNYSKSFVGFSESFSDSALIIYRVLPYNLDQEIAKYRLDTTQIHTPNLLNPFVFSSYQEPGIVSGFSTIDKRGSISRGISFGNNQDVVVNSDLNLQLNGKINDKVKILAAVTDRNIPIQAEGNTQQLQEFDRIFVKIFSDSLSLTAGDFVLDRPKGYFLNYYKRGQGVSFDYTATPFKSNKKSVLKSNVSTAISKGKFARNQIQGVEANQGPYKLIGNENESFIVVLSGTERVYINGSELIRGQNNDYTINYNTAEVTFTPKQLITKDTRIFVEFEYSDKNYTRTMLATSNELKYNNLNMRFNFISEQDRKNQPLLQDLTDSNKVLLNSIGDDLSKAIIENVDSIAFNSNEVLYRQIDTLGIKIYEHSTNPDNAFYRVGFSDVGTLNGSYTQSISSVNGRVFNFVGLGNGNFEPVTILVSPKKKQMLTLGADYQLNQRSKINFEYALSGNDFNTFSDLDNDDDLDNAFKLKYENVKQLKNNWKVNTNFDYEHSGKNFTAFKRFRAVEFNRDWNLGSAIKSETTNWLTGKVNINKGSTKSLKYTLQNFNKNNLYQGLKNNLDVSINHKSYLFSFIGSYLKSDNIIDTLSSSFYRGKAQLSKKYDKIITGLTTNFENNQFEKNKNLQSNSYNFLEWGGYIANSDSSVNSYKLSYVNRSDDSLKIADLALGNFVTSDNVSLKYTRKKNPSKLLNLNATYRNINNSFRDDQDESVIGRAEYKLNLYKGLIRSNTFYQIGSGRELRREFEYVLVQAGQGTHTWIDRDSNNVKTLDEFEVGNYADQRDHLKVFRPSNDFIKVFSNEFNQTLFLRSNPKWRKEKGVKKMMSKLSMQSIYRITRKTTDLDTKTALNPFISVVNSNLQTINSQHKHTLFYNRSNSKFGLDFSFQEIKNKSLLNNGFEGRDNQFFELKNRTAISKKLLFRLVSVTGGKQNNSQFFNARNFDIRYSKFEPKLVYQPNLNFQSNLSYELTFKNNSVDTTGLQKANMNTINYEARYNVASRSRLTFNLSYVKINYLADQNTPVAFEMLQSLRVGNNVVWNLSFVKQLKNKMQITVNYDGRKSEDVNTIHTGGVQVRAFF